MLISAVVTELARPWTSDTHLCCEQTDSGGNCVSQSAQLHCSSHSSGTHSCNREWLTTGVKSSVCRPCSTLLTHLTTVFSLSKCLMSRLSEPEPGPWIGGACINAGTPCTPVLIHLNGAEKVYEWSHGISTTPCRMRGEAERETCMTIWGYENTSRTCALNKGWSNRISDLEELGSRDCGVELGSSEQ